ncbi:MAG: hypothetical protein ACTHNS_14720 [Marmoricola sp.]
MPTAVLHSRPVRAAALTAASVLALGVASAPSDAAVHRAARSHAPSAPVITARMGNQIALSRSAVRAGQVTFRVKTAKGTHTLQLARLRNGYTLEQAGADINSAFGGDVAAVNRVDNGVDFRGGAEARPHKPGEFTTRLARGRYVVLDQSGPGLAFLTVRGTPVKRTAPASQSRIGVFSYGFDVRHTIPRTGTTTISNVADQPHFVEFQRIKAGTTRAQLKKAFSPEAAGPPDFVLPGSTGTGVISNGRSIRFHYDLPAGTYVIACFWPDKETGMPHAFMGMYHVVHLK